MKIEENYSLLNHNTFGIDVKARYFVEYHSVAELVELLQMDMVKQHPLLAIGSGSNLLFTKNFDGVVIHSKICCYETIRETDKHIYVRVGSGVVWDDFCATVAERGLGGTENLSYIPGEVGASAVQNIGAYGVEVADIISHVETVEIATGKTRLFDVSECEYGYRTSIFKTTLKNQYVVTAVEFRLDKIPQFKLDYGNLSESVASINPLTVKAVRDAVIAIRKSKLPEPSKLGNAGSFFKNPLIAESHFNQLRRQYTTMPFYRADGGLVKIPAAWLIEQCGWKGKTFGGAGVYEKQPLVLINKNNATAGDICLLADAICKSVSNKFGITIEPEVNYI
ncbi:MAG TPA: UDP-N-acetylmuramate dehydrogenase [Paludibacteraceae bacterium]|jgi:UDP-N-acetylmuramate dehydrogenase|nr:UDP-N-acetylmuramate dehydrogenase [Paludibacteraceae bacterium]HQB68952.1 UDP-N-acetylmuramate dehydrogenase [Paludibacteraceae bacterium]HRS67470.1 UDP-N-acetylmuramate dehydrogenase [Paludibacteraceae bacterium]